MNIVKMLQWLFMNKVGVHDFGGTAEGQGGIKIERRHTAEI